MNSQNFENSKDDIIPIEELRINDSIININSFDFDLIINQNKFNTEL